MLSKTNSWIVGLDLNELGRGALVFAQWLAESGDSVLGVHVLEAWTRPHIRADAVSAIRERVVTATKELHLAPLTDVTVIEAARAEDGLVQAAHGASGIVIGRAARATQSQFIRLGVVARHLLRQLPVPVIVVPPDLTAVAPGPVLLATDLGPASEQALRFARSLAASQHRSLELVHVASARQHDLIDELEPGWLAARDEREAGLAATFQDWVDLHGLGSLERYIVHGDPAVRIAAVAVERRAALVVVGSRRLGLVARAFLSSTASALAGLAVSPVAVVPLT